MRRSAKPNQRPAIDAPDDFELPPKTQWGFTPSLQNRVTEGGMSGEILTGTTLGPHVTLHHDGDSANFSIKNSSGYGNGLSIEFNEFIGSFFSLAFELPTEVALALGHQDLLRIALRSQADVPFEAYARLNLCHGPNTEQIVRMIEIGQIQSFAEFDIFHTDFEPKRAKSAWIDLIINQPAGRRILLEEVVILRRARASL